jgi:ribonucleoside-diphosphate reductase alpha subunit
MLSPKYLRIINRKNISENISFDEINNRIKKLANYTNEDYAKEPLQVNTDEITLKTISKLFDGITTIQLDEESAKVCANYESLHYNYGILGGRILVSNHLKQLKNINLITFIDRVNYINKELNNFFNPFYLQFVNDYAEILNNMIDNNRDYILTYFGFKTLEKSYLINKIETPQDLFLRVAISIHFRTTNITLEEKFKLIYNTYDLTSKGYYTHATPTLFNAGTNYEQMSSCFLLGTEDSLQGIFNTISNTALISKWAGGIGVHVSNIRANGTKINSTNGKSDGIIPMLKIYNETARYANQCFTPDTWIYTLDGPKQMQDITVEDNLITINGSFKKINEIIINQIDKEILQIKTYNSIVDVKLTDEHEIYCIKNIDNNDNVKVFDLLHNKINLPCYCSASTLQVNDLVGFPIPTYFIDNEINDSKYYYDNGFNLTIDKLLHLPNFKLLNVLHGVFNTEYFNKETFTFQHDSILLLNQIRYIILCLGMITTFENNSLIIPKNIMFLPFFKFEPVYNIFDNYFVWDNIIWCRITEINRINYSGNVYDFNMIDHHNYLTADLGLVHNSGKRKGAVAIYLEPWHADIIGFLELKKNTGAETERARDLFTALWIPDEFMRRVQNDEDWYLMCPNECPNLSDVYDKLGSNDFTNLYNKYILEKKYKNIVKARYIFTKIIESQIETGVPYICFKDNINRKSNQSNIGIIKSSNLCAEIMEVSDSNEYAVCNLASIAVNKFIRYDKLDTTILEKYVNLDTLTIEHKQELLNIFLDIYDFDKLKEISRNLTLNLNNIIDNNFYPVNETKMSNLKNRPIGIGLQGLGDIYYILNIPYSSYVAKYIDALIMETIYYGAIDESSNIAIIDGTYQTYINSPYSLNKLQFDMWFDENNLNKDTYPQMYNWDILKDKIKITGLRNSLLTALMPTASTSQILGNNECFEPYSSNIYKRTTLAGEFQVINRHLVDKLIKLNIWTEQIRNNIIINDGSIKNIETDKITLEELNYLKLVYKTIWEIKQKDVIDHALSRGPYIDQSQSMNLFFANPDFKGLYSALVYGWKNGIKTGCYYLRSQPAIEATKYSVQSVKDKECSVCSA